MLSGLLTLTILFSWAELSPNKKSCAEQLIAIFENHQLHLKYDYIEDLKDGRGFTAGRSGFCTGTGDLVLVVREYTKDVPKNPLAKYLPVLDKLAKTWSAETKELPDFEKSWKEAAKDPKFLKAQDSINDRLYLHPALRLADEVGVKRALSKVALYEAIIQHGPGDADKLDCANHDSVNAIMKRATKKAGGTPKTGVTEDKWFRAFLEERKAVLNHACKEESREVWKKSVGRADTMIQLFESKTMTSTTQSPSNRSERPSP